MAQQKPKDENEYVTHQFSVNADYDANQLVVKISVNDAITKKGWEIVLTENDYKDIKTVYEKQIKVAVNTNQMICAFPDEGKPLDLILKTQPEYISLELPEKQ